MSTTPFSLSIDQTSGIPLSRQLAVALKDAIVHGAWKPGDVLPTIHALASMARTSVKTARRALEILAKDGWTEPRRGVGSTVRDRGVDIHVRGRVLLYVRETGYSYYAVEFAATLDARLRARGYRVSVIEAIGRSEKTAVGRLASALKERWALVLMMGGGPEARRVVAESGRPFAIVGDGGPIPRVSAPSCVARFPIQSGKALPEFVHECVRRGVTSVVQFKYAEGAFDASEMLSVAGIRVATVTVPRQSSPEAVSRASLAAMRRIVAQRALPDLFLFTDDHCAQGALLALAVEGVRIPEDVAVVTHANKGLGPVWIRPLARLEMDAAVHARVLSDAIGSFLATGDFPPVPALGSVWRPSPASWPP